MNATKRSFTILLIVVAVVLAFMLGTASVTGSVPSAPQAVTPAQWAAIQASNSLLLEQGPVGTYLPFVLRR
ncbi:MAG TPA: hypothetical protein VLY63_12445 [Anaerolineae bacterium]|nr:hypothetical protein [Anaerolineae bacterium]